MAGHLAVDPPCCPCSPAFVSATVPVYKVQAKKKEKKLKENELQICRACSEVLCFYFWIPGLLYQPPNKIVRNLNIHYTTLSIKAQLSQFKGRSAKIKPNKNCKTKHKSPKCTIYIAAPLILELKNHLRPHLQHLDPRWDQPSDKMAYGLE